MKRIHFKGIMGKNNVCSDSEGTEGRYQSELPSLKVHVGNTVLCVEQLLQGHTHPKPKPCSLVA